MSWLHVHDASEQERGKCAECDLHGGSFRVFDPHLLNKGLGSFDPAFGSSNVHRNPALLFSTLGAVASGVAAGVADRVAARQHESRAKSKLLRCCASTRVADA